MAGEKAARVGPLDEVLKTSIRMPRRLLRYVDELGGKIGVTNQAIYSLGTIRMLLELSPMLGNKKRHQMVVELEQYFQNHFAEARKDV